MDSSSLYRHTLARAWRTTRTHPHAWVLGFLAAFLGNGGELEFVVTQFRELSSGAAEVGESLLAMFGAGGSTIMNALAQLLVRAQASYVLLGAAVFVVLAVLWLIIIAQGALIRAAAAGGDGALARHLTVAARSFWQLVGVVLATRLLGFFVLGVVGMPLAALLVYFLDPVKALVLVSFALGIPLLAVASLLGKYAIAYHMLEHRRWREAIARALSLFFDHWLVSLELALTLFVINIVVGGVMIVLTLVFAAPFILLTNALPRDAAMTSAVFLLVGQFLAFLPLVALGSIMATFQYASWTELFLRIRKRRHASKLVRVLALLRERHA